MNNTINLVIGDWSHDGHEKTETVTVSSNLTIKEIEKAFKIGVNKLGFDITKCCEDYEDHVLPKKANDALKKAGFKGVDEEGYFYETFADIYLFTVKQGDDSFKYKIVTNQTINIGGYGLL